MRLHLLVAVVAPLTPSGQLMPPQSWTALPYVLWTPSVTWTLRQAVFWLYLVLIVWIYFCNHCKRKAAASSRASCLSICLIAFVSFRNWFPKCDMGAMPSSILHRFSWSSFYQTDLGTLLLTSWLIIPSTFEAASS